MFAAEDQSNRNVTHRQQGACVDSDASVSLPGRIRVERAAELVIDFSVCSVRAVFIPS